jgi:glycosyltransferase involved in cell wall biosynthesis
MIPEISLLVPGYNAARFLPRLATAVQQLTVPFADVLCYDDGSTDDTVAVARQLGWRILTPNTNGGVAVARNRLVTAARTPWVHFHDADDLILPRFVERLGPACDDQHDVVCCDADWDDENSGQTLIAWRYDSTALRLAPHAHLLEQAMGLNNSIIRRSSWEKIGGCDETLTMWEDADVHIRLARAGARFHHVPEVLTRSLRRTESFSHDYRKSWRCRLDALGRYALDPSVARVRPVLASETEKAASALALLGEKSAAKKAIQLCRTLGGDPPTSAQPGIRFLKSIVPTYSLLRWQARRRQSAP